MVATLKLAVFIMEENIGNSADAGLAFSLMTLGSMFVSLFFGGIYKACKKYTPALGLVLMGLCYLLLSGAHSVAVIVVGMCCFGFCMGLVLPYLFSTMAIVAPKAKATFAIALLGMAQQLGQFFTAFYIQLIEYFTKGAARATFAVAGTVLIICAILVMIFTLATRKSSSPSATLSE